EPETHRNDIAKPLYDAERHKPLQGVGTIVKVRRHVFKVRTQAQLCTITLANDGGSQSVVGIMGCLNISPNRQFS
ncbi:hypothetical protein, partial [Pseudomonas syringae]|uniref:hypothetical protein n=1 Tax=Pseudomonas syringae TaxID=317 RepID=UPI001F3B7426